jgi:hypothetical protein
MGTVVDTAQDTDLVADVIPLSQPAAPTSPPQAPGSVRLDGLSAREVLALSSTQADVLAATVEAALAAEDARHARQLDELIEQHQQRRAVLIELADTLGQQCTDLDEAAATMPATGTPVRMFGFVAGDRVRDPRSGCTGRVRFHTLGAAERAEGRSQADVVWDGFETVTDLELAVAHGLDHAPEPPR